MRLTGLALILVLASSVLGCSGGASWKRPPPAIAIPPESISDTSAFQRQILSTDRLQFSDYESAILRTFDCFAEFGLRAQDVKLNARQQYSWGVTNADGSYFPTDADLENAQIVIERCRREYSDLVEARWRQQTAPSQAELLVARRTLADCLRGRGYDLTAEPSNDEFRALATKPDPGVGYRECIVRVQTEFGLPGFIGSF